MSSELAERLKTRLGSSYRVERELEGGGMSYVFVAEELALARKVVIKVLRTDQSVEISTERFKREILFAARLQHPHVVPVLTAGDIDGLPFYTMPFVAGESLVLRLSREGYLPIPDAVRLLAGISRALAYAHRCGVVHRDIKPGNVLVVDGTAVVTDFGIAKALMHAQGLIEGQEEVSQPTLTQLGMVIGTPAYMAPEQMMADPAMDHRADLYSFGVLAYEMLAGRRPFEATSYPLLFKAHATEVPRPLGEIRFDIPEELEAIVSQCLLKDPRERPESAASLVNALDRISSGTSSQPIGITDSGRTALGVTGVLATTIVGREADEGELLESLSRAAKRGMLHAVSGEAGMGKTTLVEHFVAVARTRRNNCRVARGRCSERLAGTEAYLPFLEALESLLSSKGGASIAGDMRKVAPAWYTLVREQTESSGTATGTGSSAGSSEQMKRQMGALLAELAKSARLILLLEDIHWADASTVDLVSYLADRFDTLPILLVVTYRQSELSVARHPFVEVQLKLRSQGTIRETPLRAFDQQDIAAYLSKQYPDHRLPDEFVTLLHQRTDGTPLFVVDLMRQLVNDGVVMLQDGSWSLEESIQDIEAELPQSIRSTIQRTVDRLDEPDRHLLIAASVQGVEFDSAIVAAALQRDSQLVEEQLERLEKVHAIIKFVDERVLARRAPSLRYAFAHILYQNTLHATLRGTRRVAISAAVVGFMEEFYGDEPSHASQLGMIHLAARQFEKAADRFLKAAQLATRLFASKEAIILSQRGIQALEPLPNSDDRTRLELELQLAMGVPLTDLHGYSAPEVERCYLRARDLASRLENTSRLIPTLHGLYRFYVVRGQLHTARSVVEQLLALAEASGNAKQVFVAKSAIVPLIHLGEYELAIELVRQGMAAYDSDADRTTYGAFMPECWVAVAHWLLGRDAEALETNRIARQIAAQQDNPFAVAYGEALTAWLHQYRGDADMVRQHSEKCIEVSRAHDFRQWLALGIMFNAWALVVQGKSESGLPQLQRGIDAFRRTGAELNLPHFLALLADARLRTGGFESGLEVIDQAIEIAEKNDDRVWEPELHRLRGELLVRLGRTRDAESAFRSAMSVAAAQKSRSLELRAALSLARLLNDARELGSASSVLSTVVRQFPDDLRTPELTEARSILST